MKGSIMNTLAALAVLIFTALPLSAAEVVTYYHNDHLGSPIAATDSTGAVVWQQAYDPWGFKLTSNTDERGYTGNWLDEETGLADHKARWYTSSIGRFTAIDPVKWHESNIHSFNRYAYSGNNPYTNVDVDGDLFLSFYLNRRDMRTDHAIIAGQVGNVGAKTAMGLHTAGSAVGLVGGTARSLLKMGLKSAKAAKDVPKGIPVPKDLPKNIHPGQQGKHILGHNNFTPGRSPLAKGVNPQQLLDGVQSGAHPIVRMTPRGQPVVDFGKTIGQFEGKGTQFGIIHHGKNGAHVVPANPVQF